MAPPTAPIPCSNLNGSSNCAELVGVVEKRGSSVYASIGLIGNNVCVIKTCLEVASSWLRDGTKPP